MPCGMTVKASVRCQNVKIQKEGFSFPGSGVKIGKHDKTANIMTSLFSEKCLSGCQQFLVCNKNIKSSSKIL